MLSPGNYESKAKVLEMIKESDREIWEQCNGNYDVVETCSMFANGAEINLMYDVILMDDAIIFCAKSNILDNEEDKGAAVILMVRSRAIRRTAELCVTKETAQYLDPPCSHIILTIPVNNCDTDSMEIIKRRLSAFCGVSLDDTNEVFSSDVSDLLDLEIINFSQFKECIRPFDLKPVYYFNSNHNGLKCIAIIRDNYSIYRSSIIFDSFLEARESSKKDIDTVSTGNFKVVKTDDIFDELLNKVVCKSRNVETNGIYYMNGRAFKSLFPREWLHCDIIDIYLLAFKSLFPREWLHCDIIDIYLNKWREQISKTNCSPLMEKYKVKIYDTFFFTRLIRRVEFDISSGTIENSSFECLHENVTRIANEKVYKLSSMYSTIFDFDLLVIPININDHWVAGIIHKPGNCLQEIKKENEDWTDINDFQSSILIYDSLINDLISYKQLCFTVLKKYMEACYGKINDSTLGKEMLFNKEKIKFFDIKDPYQQRNGYDCGLFMLEFIRQVLVNPKSVVKLIEGHSMKDVFPNFYVKCGREYLKSYVFSKIDFSKWIALYEMEQFFLVNKYGMEFKTLRSRPTECIRDKSKLKVRRRSKSSNN
uniref:ULP_PROTEASE domain-containing protein n=1 Tax=Strongyloides papillosus TaxID=174720 RepID=A0A0N5BEM4_STREA